MRVAELCAEKRFRLVDREIADPGPGQVQARVEAVGICGSDLHYFAEGGIGDTPAVYPMVLGHEPTGVILKTGPGVSGWAPGDRVILEPALYCYHCEFCLSGHHNVCANMRFMSSPEEPGYFRDVVNLPVENLLPIPSNLSFAEATLFEPLSVVLHSMRFVQLRVGESAVVWGAGPIGLLTIAMLKLSGASRIWAVEPLAHRREMARAMGADVVIDPRQVDAVRQIRAETGQRGVDVSIDCVAKDDSINHCLHVTRNAGRVVVTGVPSELRIQLEFHTLRRKELTFYNVRRSNHTSDNALRILSANPRLFAPMLTHTRPLEQIQPAFELLEQYADGVGKIVLLPGAA